MAQNHLGQDHFLLLSWIKRIGFVVILQMIVNIQSSTSIYQNGCCRPWSYQTNLQSMMYVQSKICSFFEMMFHLYSRSHSPASLMCLLQNVGWHIHCIMKFTWFQTGLLTHWFMIAPSTEVKHLKWSPKWNSKYVICSSGCINCKLIFVHVPLSIYAWFWRVYIWFNCTVEHLRKSDATWKLSTYSDSGYTNLQADVYGLLSIWYASHSILTCKSLFKIYSDVKGDL